tara:strand:+ start:5846 stop:7984 length:2139 start_codon:yes stop_codon:yes gene_type:complete
MKINKINLLSYFMIFLLSLIFFALVTDIRIINPTRINWLMDGDYGTGFFAWQFFRHTPLFQWPIGTNLNYGLDYVGSSIVYIETIPLVAIILKFFNSVLPDNFQYNGLWLLLCFILQGFFSWKILSTFTNNKILPIIGSIFFIIAPTFLFRLQFHFALSAHWLFLYAFYLYIQNKNMFKQWLLLHVISLLIMPYIFAMIIPVYIAHQIKIKKLKLINNFYLFKSLGILSVVIYITLLSTGFFMLESGTGGSGYGFFKANLLTFFDPKISSENNWSQIIPDIANGNGDYEGMAFLGIGMIFLLILSFVQFYKNFVVLKKTIISNKYIIYVLILLFIFAISNNIAVGNYEIINLQLPNFLEYLVGKVRIGGRFIWPVYYGVYIAIFALIFRFVKPSIAIPSLIFAVTLQVYDTNNMFQHHQDKFTRLLNIESPMKSELWNEFSKLYDQVIWVALPRSGYVGWMPIGDYASKNNMGTNAAHYGRSDPKRMGLYNKKLEKLVINNNFDDKSLYIFQDDLLWNVTKVRAAENDLVGSLDGFKFFAPYYLNCLQCKKPTEQILSDNSNSLFEYNMESIDFTSNSKKNPYKIYGWDVPQRDGSWTIDKEAYIYLKLVNNDKKNINLQIEAKIFSPEIIGSQDVMVYINDFFVGSVRFTNDHDFSQKNIEIPASVLSKINNDILINLVLNDAESPKDLNLHNDSRPHGLKVKSMQLNWID